MHQSPMSPWPPIFARVGIVKATLSLGCSQGCINYDELRQREQERHRRSLLALTSGACILTVVMCALTTFALIQQHEAKKQEGIARAEQQEADRQKVAAQKSEAATRLELADLYAERGGFPSAFWRTV
jgi:hypothetical protein